jgi:hypothetical protein
MEFKGRIYKVLPLQSGTTAKGDTWQRLDFIFEYFECETDRWSDKVLLSVMNDRIREYDIHEGDEVLIGFGHSVREYQGRYYNDLRIYKFESLTKTPIPSTVSDKPVPQEPEKPSDEKPDDLPF